MQVSLATQISSQASLSYRGKFVEIVGIADAVVRLGTAPPTPLAVAPMSSHPCFSPRYWILSLTFFAAVAGTLRAHEPPSSPVRRTAIVLAVDKAKFSVANIHSERNTQAPFGERGFGSSGVTGRSNGMGTGILIDPRGYIVTNFHVVDEVTSLHVRLHNDPKKYEAEVVVKDKESDLAVIKIDAGRPLPVAKIGTSSDLMVGETVIAIGNAFGYEHTVSMGIVSALGRDVTLNKEVAYKQLIQTNASINPGNSGGPLLNRNGEVVGIVTGLVNPTAENFFVGIGFAVPITVAGPTAGAPPY
jgi:serine protease Do